MKRFCALAVAALILVFTAIPAFAKSSPTPSKEYNVYIHNTNGGTATYTSNMKDDDKYVTLYAHPKNNYEFVGWKLKGKYALIEGDSSSDEVIEILLKSDVHAYPYFKYTGTGSTTSTSISINSGTVSPQTSDNNAVYFIIVFAGLFVVIAGALGIKLAAGKK